MAMTFRIQETGEIKTLSYTDIHTGCDCVNDIIGNSGAVGDYISVDDDGIYIISADNFSWWSEYISAAQSDDEELDALRSEYNPDDIRKIIDDEWRATGNDYCDHHSIRQRVIDRIKTEAHSL